MGEVLCETVREREIRVMHTTNIEKYNALRSRIVQLRSIIGIVTTLSIENYILEREKSTISI